ncbi:DNA-binding transcriptional LysR family regulator [Azonexus fungiphilus]|jgi:DNA-binding transcriptional LysR family regulator|uniref:DNA-binding transcriptional LysR family regulator n=1 Tax=Azonexus fungiphilus TaxID=146940 RepID=A0A495WJK5_9RHOO|nr:LysR family transcriptional regulator [Azonexus fungiphilus]NHC05481.1 LysR family transcriptional regulator [Azonexus fungiphilus]RKT60885.1 DNA-binding transcriptional LysR family regulator [Azonexus fungiphilus]
MNSIPDLAFFSLLARQPSLAAAAQALGITPPGVSRRLAALEQRLGVRLLNRTTRRHSLTPEGERYLEDGEAILRDIERLERSLLDSRERPQGLLRINAGFGFGRRHLGPAISDFVRRYPDIEVVLHLADRALDLTEHALDIAIRFGPPPDARILARRIAPNRRLLCAAPAYLAARGMPQTPRDLPAHDCIVIRENERAFNNWQLTDGNQQVTIKVRSPLAVNHGEIAVDWALAGHGIVLRSEWDIAGDLASGRLVRVLPEWAGVSADIHALYPSRHQLSAKVRAFLDFLEQRFAGWGEARQ